MNRFYYSALILILFLQSNTITSQHFQKIWTNNPYEPMAIIIDSAFLDGLNLQAGDEIAVFDSVPSLNDAICVGTILLDSEFLPDTCLMIIAAKDDPTTGIQDGFLPGDPMSFRYWDDSGQEEFLLVASDYNPGFESDYQVLETSISGLEGQSVLVWTGLTSNEWQDPTNWNFPAVPNDYIRISIPSSPTGGRFPMVISDASCKELNLEPGADVVIQGNLVVGDTTISQP